MSFTPEAGFIVGSLMFVALAAKSQPSFGGCVRFDHIEEFSDRRLMDKHNMEPRSKHTALHREWVRRQAFMRQHCPNQCQEQN